jgi:2-polyprenyl-3-methyl-5-hydroxy-6-metoxy-1,4-benzoquinol methylase
MATRNFDRLLDSCIVCDGGNIAPKLVDFQGISIWQCGDCGFQFMNPQYSDADLDEFYSSPYLAQQDFDLWHPVEMLINDFHLSKVEKFISPGSLLDIGCGKGHFLEAAVNRGWQVEGYDVDKATVDEVAARLRIKTSSGDFFACDFCTYDLVTLNAVLEHLKYPNRYLEKVSSLVKGGGVLFILVPNIRSLSFRFKYWLEKLGIRSKRRGNYYDTDHHVLYFSPETLGRLLAKHGFDVVFSRNGHVAKPNQTKFKRWRLKYLLEPLYPRSGFFVVARKRPA